MADDLPPPLMPELEGWAIVEASQVGPPAAAGDGRSQRLVARTGGSHLEVIYGVQLDHRENPAQLIAEKINLLVMAGDPRVLRKGEMVRLALAAAAD